jgi:hypothetical protein
MARNPRDPVDPYAAPPRHKDKSGAVLRIGLIAVMLGAAAWGYSEFARQPAQDLTAGVEDSEQMAANDEAGYAVSPTDELAPAPAPTPATPAIEEPRAAPSSAPASEPVPPPSTTIGESGR